jgi:hypothetical protein
MRIPAFYIDTKVVYPQGKIVLSHNHVTKQKILKEFLVFKV